jgi:NhaP-type Na+/H+ or K+/H+ antiporter/Trk K+ transport system NAD-binding subunit
MLQNLLMHGSILELVLIFVIGAVCQWASWRLRVPAILLLLLSGIVIGPVTGVLDPDQLFGELLFPLVSLAVAVILFEGGLDLHLKEFDDKKAAIVSLVTVGCLVNCILIALAGHYVLGLNFHISFLIGGVLSVSGPTVVQPLLRFIKPREPVYSILKWEGILIDPVGAVLAALILEEILLDASELSIISISLGLVGTLAIGSLIGYLFGRCLIYLSKDRSLPDELYSTFSLACLFGAFVISNMFFAEAGLVAVTVMGVAVGNEKLGAVRHIISFKENLRVLLISALFIVLAARVDLSLLLGLKFPELIFLAVVIFIARPTSVFVSTLFQGLTVKDRLFISWMFPRGIVAAAVASLFAIELDRAGIAGGDVLVSTVFLVILTTVILYGSSGAQVANVLGVSLKKPTHYLFVGINTFSLALVKVLRQENISLMLVDTNIEKVRSARQVGAPASHGNLLSQEMLEEMDIVLVDKSFVMTGNLEANLLLQHRLDVALGARKSFLVIPDNMEESCEALDNDALQHLFPNAKMTLLDLEAHIACGAEIKIEEISEETDPVEVLLQYDASRELLFIREKRLFPCKGRDTKLQPEDKLIFLQMPN